ncbi:hypothetical protein C0991_004225 [Blastosporella zonata]|nr:hypothetical protein C0991_004225 [Blastosporella zonata]
MSSSPRDPQDDADEKQTLDELDDQPGGDTEGGEYSFLFALSMPDHLAQSWIFTDRARSSIMSEKKPDDEADTDPPTKRKRGRPPKNPKSETGDAAGGSGDAPELSAKKKRGRPSKKAAD